MGLKITFYPKKHLFINIKYFIMCKWGIYFRYNLCRIIFWIRKHVKCHYIESRLSLIAECHVVLIADYFKGVCTKSRYARVRYVRLHIVKQYQGLRSAIRRRPIRKRHYAVAPWRFEVSRREQRHREWRSNADVSISHMILRSCVSQHLHLRAPGVRNATRCEFRSR